MAPRIFVSAVTSELKTARQLVANALTRLGYEPVWQEIFGTESGDLRQVLCEKIDDCDGLIQLVGRGYGAEPPTVGAEFAQDGFTRVSYTQFEFLHARARGKRTWLIYTDEGCTLDHPLEQLDLPRDPAHPDPAGYQSERRALQEAWRQRWKQEGHLRHGASSDTDLELKVERLRDEFRELRRAFRSWQRDVMRSLIVAGILLLIVGTGVGWIVFRQSDQLAQAIAEQMAKVRPDEIKGQLSKTIEATYQREMREAEQFTDWQKRDEAKRGATVARVRRLEQVDEFLASITGTIQSGGASPEFLELTRIMQEEGVDQALVYVTSQESLLLERGERLAAETQSELRRTLAPLLEGVRLHRAKGELTAARTMCDKLLKQDADWPGVLHEHCRTMIELGDRAQKYETIEIALADYETAILSAKRLVEADALSPIWQRDLASSLIGQGDVFVKLGRTNDAQRTYEDYSKICRALAEADPGDAHKQLALAVSLERLGDVFLKQGRTDDALRQFEEYSKICRVLAERNPGDSETQSYLADSYARLGGVSLTLGRTDEALRMSEDFLNISRTLADADPRDAGKQYSLSAAHERLGNLLLQLSRTNDGLRQFEDALKIARVVAESDPRDSGKQRHLSTSYEGLGNALVRLGRTDDAIQMFEESSTIRGLLTEADPRDTQKQSDLSQSHERLGEMYLALGRSDEALRKFEAALKIARVLAEADPLDARKQHRFFVSSIKVGDVLLKLDRTDDALRRLEEALKIARALADADPRDTNAQSALAFAINNLGDVFLKLDRTDDALPHFEEGFSISRRLTEADPRNADMQHQHSISHQRLGDVFFTQGRMDDALRQFEGGFTIARALADADPLNVHKQRDLSVFYTRLGDVALKQDRTDDALRNFEASLNIFRVIADADPGDAQKQRAQMVGHYKLGEVQVRLANYDAAIARFQQGIAVLDAMIEKRLHVESATSEKAGLEKRIQFCRTAIIATGDWDTLLKSDAKLLPARLSLRATELARRGQLTGVVQTAAKLRELEPGTKDNLYDAACAYALCATLVTKHNPAPTEAEQAERKNFIDLSLACLKESLAAGYDNFEHMRKDSDLTALRGLPEFEAMFPKKAE